MSNKLLTDTERINFLQKELSEARRELNDKGRTIQDIMGRHRGYETLIESIRRVIDDYNRLLHMQNELYELCLTQADEFRDGNIMDTIRRVFEEYSELKGESK